MIMRQNVLIAALSIYLIVATSVIAAPRVVPITPDLTANGWKVLAFDGIPATQFTGTADGTLESAGQIAVPACCIASSTTAQACRVNSRGRGRSSMHFRQLTLSKTDGDDRVLALHIGFADDSFLSRLKGAMSPFAKGRVLTYVWGGCPGSIVSASASAGKTVFMIIRRTAAAPNDTWFQENVDLAADFKRAFGEAPPPISYVGISGDADDIASMCFGKIKDIQFN